jgi:hypothetical protein
VVQRYIHGRPPADSYAATLMDQFTYAVNVGQRTVHVHLWDTRTLSPHRSHTARACADARAHGCKPS